MTSSHEDRGTGPQGMWQLLAGAEGQTVSKHTAGWRHVVAMESTLVNMQIVQVQLCRRAGPFRRPNHP